MHKPLTLADKERLAELVAANTPLSEICEVIGRDRWTTRRNINYLARRARGAAATVHRRRLRRGDDVGMAAARLSREENTSSRLEAYVARSQTALDLFALCTLWIIAVPVANFGAGSEVTLGGVLLRLSVSVVFGVDMAIRSMLAPQRFNYLRTHPLGLFAVIFPPVRVLFSLRLITSLFRRGHIERFMAAASLLLLNGVLIVFFYERNAPGSSITSIGNALWWAVVTVSTVGYGDMYPVTVGGRVVATGIMAIGILTLAVITAQVSSSYVDQAARRRAAADGPVAKEPADAPLQLQHLTALHDRLDRIESQLRAASEAERAPTADDD